jgi:hypothetical protein
MTDLETIKRLQSRNSEMHNKISKQKGEISLLTEACLQLKRDRERLASELRWIKGTS